jgi:hypothetical protein
LQLVKSVTPVEVREKCDKEAQINGMSVNDDKLNTNPQRHLPVIGYLKLI